MEEIKAKIIKDIEATGFLTELKVASKFIERNWKISQSETYLDKDFNISREIDIIASYGAADNEKLCTIQLDLVIEVKKDTKRPWVIFTTDKNQSFEEDQNWAAVIHCGENYTTTTSTIFWPNKISENIHKDKHKRIGRAFHEAFKSPQENSKIYEALISCCKAAIFKKEQFFPKPFEKDFEKGSDTILNLIIPVVLLDGNLYETYLDKNGEIALEERNWIPIKMNYSSRNYTDMFGTTTFYPDVVTVNGLDDYLNLVVEWFGTIFPQLFDTIEKWRRDELKCISKY